MKFPRPQMARSASAYYWLSEIAGSQLSPAACEKSWHALEYKAILSSIGANFCSIARNVPLQSFVGRLRYCRSYVVLCNTPLW